MKTADIIRHIADVLNVSHQEAKRCLDAVGNAALYALADIDDGEFTLPNAVKISVRAREARRGRNPRTGEAIAIPAKLVPKCVPLATLRRAFEITLAAPRRMVGGERNSPMIGTAHPPIAATPAEVADPGTVRLGSSCISAEMPR